MATSEHTTGTRDEQYNVISILYHALQGAETCATYLQDAEGHDDVRAFFEEVARQDAERAVKAHQLLGSLTSGSAGLSPSAS